MGTNQTMSKIILPLTLLLAVGIGFSLKGYCQTTAHPMQRVSPKTTFMAFDFTAGGQQVADEYLSPIGYGGYHIGGNIIIETPLTQRQPIFLRLSSTFNYSHSLNPAKNSLLTGYMLQLNSESHYKFDLGKGFCLTTGAGIRSHLESRYMPSNVNNQYAGDLRFELTAASQLAYLVPIKKFPATVRFYANIGLIGMSHKLGYTQSYFEKIYHDGGLAHSFWFTYLGNTALSNALLTVDMPLWNICTLRLGYQISPDYLNLANRKFTALRQSVLLGFSFETLWFTGRSAILSSSHRSILFPNTIQ